MIENLRLIFSIYGGWRSLLRSSYLYYSLIFDTLLWRSALSGRWVDNAKDLLPSILGFSIAALAIITAMGDQKFRENMAKIDTIRPGESDLTVIVANFCWFIFIQMLAVLVGLAFEAKPFPDACRFPTTCFSCEGWNATINVMVSFIGQFLMIYGILLLLAAVFQMMSIFRLYLRNL